MRELVIEAEHLWTTGQNIAEEFGKRLLEALGYKYDRATTEVIIGNRRKHAIYLKFLSRDSTLDHFGKDSLHVDETADTLARLYGALVTKVRVLEASGGLFPTVPGSSLRSVFPSEIEP